MQNVRALISHNNATPLFFVVNPSCKNCNPFVFYVHCFLRNMPSLHVQGSFWNLGVSLVYHGTYSVIQPAFYPQTYRPRYHRQLQARKTLGRDVYRNMLHFKVTPVYCVVAQLDKANYSWNMAQHLMSPTCVCFTVLLPCISQDQLAVYSQLELQWHVEL